MSRPKYAQSTDLNQKEIVDALNEIPGVKAMVVGSPVDLLVGYRARNILLEVKRPGEKPRTETQRQFLKTWPGQVRVVETIDEAVQCVLRCYEH